MRESSPDSPAFYYLLNFNSFASSLVTLFHFMVINNWFLTITMYIKVTDLVMPPAIFFVTFWCSVVLVLLNVLISLILEIYTSVEPEVTQRAKKTELTIKLAKIVEGVDRETLRDKFTEVKRRL